MLLSNLQRPKGANKNKKRVGRGIGSGHATTACRGGKGHTARSGYKSKPGFEGGQMPLYRALGKSGFTNIFKKQYFILNLSDIERLTLDKVNLSILKERKLIPKHVQYLKILGNGTLSKAVEVEAHKISKKANEVILVNKGKVIIL